MVSVVACLTVVMWPRAVPRLLVLLGGLLLLWLLFLYSSSSCSTADCDCPDGYSGRHGSLAPPRGVGVGAAVAVGARLPSTWLVIVILSAPGEQRQRDTIRQTWLRLSTAGPDTVWHRFPIGLKALSNEEITALRREQSAHGDLLFLEEHEERYGALTNKIKRTFVAVTEQMRFDFLLKVDVDSFVRLSVLLQALRQQAHPTLYWGFLRGNARVKTRGKWKEDEFRLCDRYMPYMVGGGYVLSQVLVSLIANNSVWLKSYANEDVSVGVWLAGFNVHYVHDPRFDTEWMSRGCSNEYLVTHKQTEADMRRKFETLKTTRNLCDREYRSRGSYMYDWSVLPSLCCQRTNASHVP